MLEQDCGFPWGEGVTPRDPVRPYPDSPHRPPNHPPFTPAPCVAHLCFYTQSLGHGLRANWPSVSAQAAPLSAAPGTPLLTGSLPGLSAQFKRNTHKGDFGSPHLPPVRAPC